MVVLTYGMHWFYRYNKYKLYARSYMSTFDSKIIHRENMAELTPDLYQELLRYNSQATNILNRPIYLSKFRARQNKIEAA